MCNESKYKMPVRTMLALVRYRDQHIQPGGFLTSVLENNLVWALKLADEENKAALESIVSWCYWELPACSWGSKKAVENWVTVSHPATEPPDICPIPFYYKDMEDSNV